MSSRKALYVLVIAVTMTSAFIGGYMVASRLQQRSRYLNSKEFLEHLGIVPVGKLAAGTYYIPLGRWHNSVMLMITVGSRAGVARKIVLDDTGVYFQYEVRNRRYGVPSATLSTGKDGKMWIDLGLKGRFSMKVGPHQVEYYLLHGNWVSPDKLHFVGMSTMCYYKGHKYYFDKAIGDWEPVHATHPVSTQHIIVPRNNALGGTR